MTAAAVMLWLALLLSQLPELTRRDGRERVLFALLALMSLPALLALAGGRPPAVGIGGVYAFMERIGLSYALWR